MIKISNLIKQFESKVVFDNFNLEIKKGKITCILGESGAGKTTLLNILNGVESFNGEISGLDKPISNVFQENRLIPNLTVEQNLKLIIRTGAVDEMLDGVGLQGTKNLYPKELSAGMARRVAIARALNFPAKTLLLDEPLINLDLSLKFMLIEKLKAKQKADKSTVIMVTHDIKEAVMLADCIVVLKSGKIVFSEKRVNKNTEEKLLSVLIGKI